MGKHQNDHKSVKVFKIANLREGERESDLIYVVVVVVAAAAARKCMHTRMSFASALLHVLAQPHTKHSAHSVKPRNNRQFSVVVTGKQRFNPP